MKSSIRGLQEAQRGNLKMVAAMKPEGGFGEAIRAGTVAAHRYAVVETHVDTGALRASHRMKVSRLEGKVSIDPSARNPRSNALVAQYGAVEEARGGEHAFYDRAVNRHGSNIAKQITAALISRMPQ